MLERYRKINGLARKWLWLLTIVGILAAVPLGFVRTQMESTSTAVEFVYDYRDIVQVANFQANPASYTQAQLREIRAAGVTTMAIFESTLEELAWAGRLYVYNSTQQAALKGAPPQPDENFTYVLFAGAAEAEALAPLIQAMAERIEVPVYPWEFAGRTGLVLAAPVEQVIIQPMPPDPLAMKQLNELGFALMPRLSDRIRPFDAERLEMMLDTFETYGVRRLLFDGGAVTGFNDHAAERSLDQFGALLQARGIGVAVIENLRNPQNGMNTLAYLTNYNAVRLYSLSEADALNLSPAVIADRFVLAAKDRNIRLFYLNAASTRSLERGGIFNSFANVQDALLGNGTTKGAIALLEENGFQIGPAVPFEVRSPEWALPLKAVVAAGAVALIALLVGAFVPLLLLPAFAGGLALSGLLFLRSTSLLEQALALGAAIAAPTLAMIWVIGRVRLHTEGDRRSVGGQWREASLAAQSRDRAGDRDRDRDRVQSASKSLFSGQWIFPGLSARRRLVMAIGLYTATAIVSFVAVPFIVGLMSEITYMIKLEQFRGVSLLHLAPIALTAAYLLLYTGGGSVLGHLRKLLRLQITLLWVVVAGIAGVVGVYYLSRTGNAGSASSLELLFRNFLETTIGVRPRFKEFLLAHPIFLFGLFLALRYRAAWVLMIIASIGQLSMVDTFAHIHTPLHLSAIRGLLGLGLGALLGLVLIAGWQLAEGAWRKWGSSLKAMISRYSG